MIKTELSSEARTALRHYAELTHGDLSDTERLAEYCYNAGFREAVAAMVTFQDLHGRIAGIERRVHELGELLKHQYPVQS